ncbi:MAG: SulP family inorganic anion transporter [Candidatus Gracilibacteria bacterium]|jgi:SulP family sulfate permease
MNSMLSNLKNNWKSGLTVSLVSIPLSISLAVASGVGPMAGIITAIWAGLIASFFAGSHYNIVGPTGALSGLIAAFVLSHGVDQVSSLALVSGVLILGAYFLKLERYLIFVPSSVIHGFTLGVAFIIAGNQVNFALGLKDLPAHDRFFENLVESFAHLSQTSILSFLVFLAFLLTLFLLRRFLPRIPGAILLSPLGILLGYLGQTEKIPFALDTLGTHFGTLSFSLFQIPQIHFSAPLLTASVTIALIAILETMLSAKIADGMTRTKHKERKEMLALGLANLASGAMGGIPATAALARTSLNIKTGADHKISATISSIAVGLISFFLFAYFSYIPMAVIASILVYTAINMVEMEHFGRFFKHERSSFFVSLLVAGVTVYEDPIVGILLGTALVLILFVERLSRGAFELAEVSDGKLKEIKEDSEISLYSFKGKLCYLNGRAHIARFETGLSSKKSIILRLREVYFMDLDGVEALDEIIELLESRGQKVLLTSLHPTVEHLLEEVSKTYSRLKKEGLVFDKTVFALKHLGV